MYLCCVQTADECLDHHNVTLCFSDNSCSDVSMSVPWPGHSASLKQQSSCLESVSLSVRVHAVNSDGLAGPAAQVLLPNTHTATTVSFTSAVSHTSSDDIETIHSSSEFDLPVYPGCPNGSGDLCQSRPVDRQPCLASERDGRVLILNRTEMTIAVQLVFSFILPLHTRLIVVRTLQLQILFLCAGLIHTLSRHVECMICRPLHYIGVI